MATKEGGDGAQQRERAAAPAGAAPLNGPWVRTTDKQGRSYFWNRQTNVTAWHPPPGWVEPPVQPAPRVAGRISVNLNPNVAAVP